MGSSPANVIFSDSIFLFGGIKELQSKNKIAVIGGGNIGGTIAHLSSHKGWETVILDRTSDYAKGKALDIEHTLPIEAIDGSITGTDSYSDISGADVVIVTAGIPRQPGMSRDDLLSTNAEVMKVVADGIKQYAKDAFVIVVTNPLDVMVYALQKFSGLPTSKVVGMAGVLDSSRFRLFLAKELNVSVEDVSTFVLGGHGDSMVPMSRYTTVAGIPISEIIHMGWLTESKLKEIIERNKNGGAEIVKLLQKGSAFYAPAVSALEMAESYLLNRRRILPCAAYLTSEYGHKNIYAGVPVIIGKNGVEKIIELKLTPSEKEAFDNSVGSVRHLIEAMEKIMN